MSDNAFLAFINWFIKWSSMSISVVNFGNSFKVGTLGITSGSANTYWVSIFVSLKLIPVHLSSIFVSDKLKLAVPSIIASIFNNCDVV